MKDYFVLSFKNLKKRGIRSWLTLLGILIGIAAVVSLISLGNALKDSVNAQFGVESTELLSVQAGGLNNLGPPGSGAVNALQRGDVDAISNLDSVDIAIGRNIESLKMEFNDVLIFSFSGSIPDDDLKKDLYEFQEMEAERGRMIETGDSGVVVLGGNFADKDKSGFGKAVEAGDKIVINSKEFRVIGIMKKRGSFFLDSIVLIQDKDLEEIADIGEDIDIIAVKAKSKETMDIAKEDIEKLLRKRRDVKIGEEDFEVSTPEASLAAVNQVLMGIQIFIVIIASISILVGAIGITNTMATSVLERKRDIGIMKAIGARNEDIFWQFFIEAGLLGLIGGLLGIVGGLGAGYLGVNVLNDFLGTQTSINIDFVFLFLVLSGSFLVGSVSGILPAMRAANLNPVEALRG